MSTAVEGLYIWNVILSFTCAGNEGNRSYGNTLVDNWHSEFLFNILTGLNTMYRYELEFVNGTFRFELQSNVAKY